MALGTSLKQSETAQLVAMIRIAFQLEERSERVASCSKAKHPKFTKVQKCNEGISSFLQATNYQLLAMSYHLEE